MAIKAVWTDGVSYCVAESGGEALRIWCGAIGEGPGDYDEAAWGPLPDDHVLVGNEHDDGPPFETKACSEWAKGEKRYLFSTER